MNLQRPRILYIEDQPEMIDLVRLTLHRLGYEVVGAPDGREGLRLMRELHPDLVLLDLMLPGVDGWAVRDAMLADEMLRKLPMILVTARASATCHSHCRALPPADAYITKPFSLGEMRSTVQAVLERQPKSA